MTARSIERGLSPEFDVIAATEGVVTEYATTDGVNERVDFCEHALRLYKYTGSFAGNLMPNEALAAALLHDVADRLHNKASNKSTPERRAAAGLAMGEVFTDPGLGHEEGEYILCLLADMIKTESNSGDHRVKMANRSSNGNGASPEVIKMISENYTGKIPAEVWGRVEPLIEFDNMRRFIKDVNLESIIIKSCELVDNMRHPSSERESAWLQDVLEAESFYAPNMEVLGLDGLASMLRSEAHILRLEGQGRFDLINKANYTYQSIERVGIENIVTNILGGESAIHPSVRELNPGKKNYPVHIGEFTADTGGGLVVAGNYRLKTVGSLANKMNGKYEGEIPTDILGLTVISNDNQSMANDFVNFIADRLPNFKTQVARGKNRPIYVQGTTDYINQIKLAMKARGIDESVCQFEEDKDIFVEARGYKYYEVAKVTFIAEQDGVEVPTEVQFVTKEERRRARLGEVSHIIYKYLNQLPKIDGQDRYKDMSDDEKVEFLKRRAKRDLPIIAAAVETLEDSYERKKYMSPYDLKVNRRSLTRGQALADDILALAA